MRGSWFPMLLACALALAAGVVLAAGESPATYASTATTEALSPILRTDGWCFATSTTAADAWSSAPGRVTAGIKQKVRVIEVLNTDSIDVCAKLGPTGSSDGLTCALDSGTAGLLPDAGSSLRFALARDFSDGTVPPVWLRAASGTPTACLSIAW